MPVDVFLIAMPNRQLVCEWVEESHIISSPLTRGRALRIQPYDEFAVLLPRSRQRLT